MEETHITVAMIGNVDSGKSTTIGVLTTDMLDDGRGSARTSVLKHPHEHETGCTSDVSYQYYKDTDNHRIYTFIDLAGHENYLKTTISGLSAGYPDLAICCIADKITHMTKEHLNIVFEMKIPTIVVFTKADMYANSRNKKGKQLVNQLNTFIRSIGKKLHVVRELSDFNRVAKCSKFVPILKISNVTGEGIQLLKQILGTIQCIDYHLIDGFCVERTYIVAGHGVIVCGITGVEICVGDQLYIGPLQSRTCYITTKVKSIHNDYRENVTTVQPGTKCCLCIKVNKRVRKLLKPGTLLRHEKPMNVCTTLKAKLKVLHHSTTIGAGYKAYMYCGMLRSAVVITDIEHIARSGDVVYATIQFINNIVKYVEPGQKIIIREGQTKCVGSVVQIIN